MVEAIKQINKERMVFWTLLGILVLSVGFYMYCINATVRNVVSTEQLENDASKISLDISNNESKYISMRNSITIETAYAMGFKNTDQKTFIETNPNHGVVSYLPKGL